jgi:hypothetical protein
MYHTETREPNPPCISGLLVLDRFLHYCPLLFKMPRALLALIAVLSVPAPLLAQSVTLGGSSSVAAADDFAARSFQDPWDMNERTDFGWFLNGVDQPVANLTNVSFAGGVFSTTASGNESQVFLLEAAVLGAARTGKIGANHPIDANTYRVFAIRMNVSAAATARLLWTRETLFDGTGTFSGTFNLTPGWRTYLVSIPGLGLAGGGNVPWSGVMKALQLLIHPPGGSPITWQIDWVRLVNENPSFCRNVTWSGFSGAVDLYLDVDSVTNGNEWLIEDGVVNNTASAGCSPTGSGYNFAAGAMAPGGYWLVARPAGSGSGGARSSGGYTINAIPTLTITSPSEEGSLDDFATTWLGNAWDMDALSDVDAFFNVTGQTITTIAAETESGTSLGNVRVLWAQNGQPNPSDPVLGLLWLRNALIDPIRYRILTVEFGLPNAARWIGAGSVARVSWRVSGSADTVSDDMIVNSRVGANVMQKLIVDMADRNVLPIEQGTAGWVPGNGATPGIDRFRFDVHEFGNATPFFIRRVKLAAFERVAPGTNYTIRWTASEPTGTVTVYYDTDKNPTNGMTLIGSAPTNAGSLVWTTPNVGGSPAYYIHARVDDGQGNQNTLYSRWPVVVGIGTGGSLTMPANLRVVR